MAKAEPIEGLDCNASVEAALPLVLGRRLSEMISMRKQALNFNDPEGVHDMRVSSRRLRSALRDFTPHLRRAKISRQLKELKALADCLGKVRDDDVAIIALEKLVAKAPPELSEALHQLIAHRKDWRKEAQKGLVACLNHRHLVALQKEFIKSLTGAIPSETDHPKPSVTYKRFAVQTIRGRIRELRKLSTSLHNPHKANPLHDMRIAAKRLRYAVELFSPCWGESLKGYGDHIAKLQTSLGELHDCDLWIEYCGERLSKLSKKKDSEPGEFLEKNAITWLLGHFARVRSKHYRDALDRWHDWDTENLLDELLNKLKPPTPPIQPPESQPDQDPEAPKVE